MKKSFLLIGLLLVFFILGGCSAKEKTFTGSGITITVTDRFVEKEVPQFPFYIEDETKCFMGMRESKELVNSYGITTLNGYTTAVLQNANKNSKINIYEEDDVIFQYAYYTSTVEDKTFGYMLVTMESKTYFYTMNFACYEQNLEKNKNLFMKWAKTIKVE